jgi:DNA (cytosine-5)-methyltransferase 1
MQQSIFTGDSDNMRHLDLFSGIGGFALACRMVGGIETVGFCEREPYAQKVLKKHWPDAPICNDIHEMKGNEYGTIDLITGGFPCQPYSLAGERRGNEDDRALWPQMLRVISEARPAWVLGENVPGIITLALDGVLADLEAQGYACETLCIPACGVDAKHRRERIWIVGHATGARIQRDGASGQQKPLAYAGTSLPVRSSCTMADTSGGQDLGGECRDVAEASGCGQRGNASAVSGCKAVVCNASSERLPDWAGGEMGQPCPITEFERPSGREIERDFRGVAHGVSRRVDRLRGLGNAIVPQVAAEIIAAMKAVNSQFTL